MPSPRSYSPVVLGLLAGLIALAFQAPAAWPGDFIWDDVPLLLSNDLYTSTARWAESLTTPLGGETAYWRPLATSSFLMDTLLHGGQAAGFRITAAVLHATSTGLAFVLMRRLLRSDIAALLAALAWSLHPVHVETVTWISARFDVLSGLFILGALVASRGISSDSTAKRTRAWWGVGAFAAAAMLSKENAVVLPFALLAWCGALDGGALDDGARDGAASLRNVVVRRGRLALAAVAGIAAALVWRMERTGLFLSTSDTSLEAAGGGLERVLLVGRATAAYLEALVFPWTGVGPAHHAVRPVPPGDLLGWSGLLLLAIGISVLVVLWRRAPVAAWLLAAFGISLAPVLQIVPLDISGGLHAADRFLYLPSFFAVALGAVGLRALAARLSSPRTIAAIACALALAFGAFRTLLVPRWLSPDRFWAWAVEDAPDSTITVANRVDVLLTYGWPGTARLEEAERLARRLPQLDPSYRYAHQLAEIFLLRQRADRALEVAEAGARLRSDDVAYLVLVGRAQLMLGDAAAAESVFRAAAELAASQRDTHFLSWEPEAYAGLAEAQLLRTNDRAAARDSLLRAAQFLDRAPSSARAEVARGWFLLGDHAQAIRVLGDGSRVAPIRWPAVIYTAANAAAPPDRVDELAEVAASAGVPDVVLLRMRALGRERADRWDLAAMYYSAVTKLLPEDARAWDDYGYALFENGDDAGCETALRRALEVDPGYGNARLHLGVLLRIMGQEQAGVDVLKEALADAESEGNAGLIALLKRQLARTPEEARRRGR